MSGEPFWATDELLDFVARVQGAMERRRLMITIETDASTIFEVDPLEQAQGLLATAAGDDAWWDQARVLEAHWES